MPRSGLAISAVLAVKLVSTVPGAGAGGGGGVAPLRRQAWLTLAVLQVVTENATWPSWAGAVRQRLVAASLSCDSVPPGSGTVSKRCRVWLDWQVPSSTNEPLLVPVAATHRLA